MGRGGEERNLIIPYEIEIQFKASLECKFYLYFKLKGSPYIYIQIL